MHAVKYITITACEGPDRDFAFKDKQFSSYQVVDQILRLLSPRNEDMPGCYKCFVTITFDDDTTYSVKLELTWNHRCRAAILLPHVVSHCEVFSGRIMPPNQTPDGWARYLDMLEGSTPGMRSRYRKMLDEYLP